MSAGRPYPGPRHGAGQIRDALSLAVLVVAAFAPLFAIVRAC